MSPHVPWDNSTSSSSSAHVSLPQKYHMGSLISSSTIDFQTSDQCAKLMTGNQGYGINPTPVNLQRTSRTSSLELWHHSTSSSCKMDLECHEGIGLGIQRMMMMMMMMMAV